MSATNQPLAGDEVLILGVGMTPVGEHWERSLRELALEAISQARAQAPTLQPQALYVANMLAASLSGQVQLATLLADFAGMRGIEALTVEAAGASGGAAFRQALLALRSGGLSVALVLGVEKVTDRPAAEVEAALASATDADYEAVQGVTPAAQAALLMRRYLHENQAPADALAGFSLVAHANAAGAAHAMYRRAIKAEQYRAAPVLCDPLNLFDAAPMVDGAAALLLARADALPRELPVLPVRVIGSASATTAVALHDQPDPLSMPAARASARQAMQQAGIERGQIDLFELHDIFSIYAALSLEATGFARRGQGWKLAAQGAIARDGSIPISTFGGSKARGDTGGATGVYQLAEVALQLRGKAGENQVPEARIGMAQCLGGAAATVVTHLLQRVEPL
jgi:acetyl-CoA C-acetyltransferase